MDGHRCLRKLDLTNADTHGPGYHGPTLQKPDDLLVECDAIPVPAAVEAFDNCSTVAVEFIEETMGPCAGRVTELTLQYQGSNTIYLVLEQRLPKSHAVAYEGWLAPGEIFSFNGTGKEGVLGSTVKMYIDGDYYGDIHTSCSIPIGPGMIIGDFEVLEGKSRDGGILCPVDDTACIEHCRYSLFRTWTATDVCGNTTSVTQRIDVADFTVPELVGTPSDVTVACDDVPAPPDVSATDNCANALNVQFTEQRADGASLDQYLLTRIWYIADDCNNAASATQRVTVVDLDLPTLSGVPADTVVECDNVPVSADVTAADNCDPQPLLVFEESETEGACSNSYGLVRIWHATDRSGNSLSVTQQISVVDTTAPILTGLSPSRTVEYDAVPAPDVANAIDGCAGIILVLFGETSTAGPEPGPYVISRTYSAEDACGNHTNVLQTISVNGPEPIHIEEVTAAALEEGFMIQFETSGGLDISPEYCIGPLSNDSVWLPLPTTSESYENGIYSFTFDPPAPDIVTLFIRIVRAGE